uniref:Ethanolaminephosphotransferase n=1 Tax=Rhipicephalus appendiculatus TaxID=34631 RepID=A0A131YUN2_RHIAP
MYAKQWCILWFVAVTYIIGLTLFGCGFLGVVKKPAGHSSAEEVNYPYKICEVSEAAKPATAVAPKPKLKLVFVLIDALRFDFVASRPESMPFVTSLLQSNGAALYRCQGYSPTVTLPRIKTLLTGMVPGFGDVALNLNAAAIGDDNWVYQARTAGLRVAFYGDDTWLRILPGHFNRHDGTTSFFVSDYTEVDHNVSRHVPDEMEARDWDVLILHYLGLDHIGHSHGPSSPLVDRKLAEMDDILSVIHGSLSERTDENHLILITGDHGMTTAGNHGGSSELEVITPLILIPTRGWTLDRWHTAVAQTVAQVDVAPTLSLLMGLPIPKGSFGIAVPAVLAAANYTTSEQLYLLQYNLQQLLSVYEAEFGSDDKLFAQAKEVLCTFLDVPHSIQNSTKQEAAARQSLLLNIMSDIQSALLSASTVVDMTLVGTGVSVSLKGSLTLFMLMLSIVQGYSHRIPQIRQTAFVLSAMLAFFEYSTLCAFFPSSQSCSNGTWSGLLSLLSATVTALATSFFFWPFYRLETPEFPHIFILSCTILHGISFVSSSFIEEEHLTWYFITTTVVLILCFYYSRLSVHSPLLTFRKGLGIMALLRVLRSWNSTGDKWAHVPDIADWLGNSSNRHVLAFLIFLGIMAVILTTVRQGKQFSSFLLYLALLDLCLYKMKLIYYGDAKGVENFYWYLPLLVVLGIFQQYRSGNVCDFLTAVIQSWMLLCLLLHVPQNVPMFTLVIVLENAVNDLLCELPLTATYRALLYLWFGMCCHFHQGNSNKLSTISVSAGYVGVGSYNPFLVGLLMVSHTYSSLIFWLLMFWKRFTQSQIQELKRGHGRTRLLVCCTFLLAKFSVTAWYLALMLIQRYHLFVLTVFSPKLIYEAAHAVVVLLITFIAAVLLC